MDKKNILKKYISVKLANDNWGACRPYYAADFSNADNLISVMYDILSGETDLNDDGRKFLDEYWGLKNIADMLLNYEELDGNFHKTFKNKDEIVDWISHEKELRILTKEEEVKLHIINDFFKKYGGIKLGGLIGVQLKEYYIGQLNTDEQVLDFIVNLAKSITYLTLTGYEYLKERFGLKNLAKMLYEKYPEYSKGDSDKTTKWLIEEKYKFIK